MKAQVWLLVVLVVAVLLSPVHNTMAQTPGVRAEVVALSQQAEKLKKASQFAEATKVYEKIVEKAQRVFGPNHPDTAILTTNLAALYETMGQYAKAEPLYLRSLKIREARLGKDHPDVATSLDYMVRLYGVMGEYAKAEPLCQRSLKIREAQFDKDHPDVAHSLNSLAVLYQAMGQYAKAEPLYRRSLKILQTQLDKDHPLVAHSLNNLGNLYMVMGEYAKAEPLYQRSLKINETRLGKDHPDVANSLNSLAGLYHLTAQYAKAEPLYQRSLKIWQVKLGKDHLQVAFCLNNLGNLYQLTGQYAKAEALYQQSLQIWEAKLGKDPSYVADCLNSLATLRASRDNPNKAATLLDRAQRIARKNLATTLPMLSQPEKVTFFQNTPVRKSFWMALSLGLAHPKDSQIASLSASWLLNGKAMDQESLASALLLTRQSNDPSVGKLSAQLLSVRQQLARLTFATPRQGQEKQRLQQLEQLSQQAQQLSKQLRQHGSKAASANWVELQQVRKALPADAVLIDIARFDVFGFKAKPGKHRQPPRYVAWLTTRTGKVQVVDLGPAEKIDSTVSEMHQAIQQARQQVRDKGEVQAEKQIRLPLQRLSTLLLHPLLPHIGTHKQWLISPDGNLWLLPWEALLLKDGHFAIEKYRISYLISGRSLLAVNSKIKPRQSLVLADPDYDLLPDKATAQRPRMLGKVDEPFTRSLSRTLRLGEVPRLPGTAAEAKAITPSLQRYTGLAPVVHTQQRALEAVFKSVRHPGVVVLSTHGFFLPDQEVAPAPTGLPGNGRPKVRCENPLLRCGLLLAGCNHFHRTSSADDGVLTGLEVVGTDLRGCDLVVLSACDTGLGKVQIGEGVAGLRQAFQLAGAKAVVSSLWKVPDKQSARLMALFFRNLSGGMSKAEALRAAKLQIINERREDYAAAHPFFWAAFTLTAEAEDGIADNKHEPTTAPKPPRMVADVRDQDGTERVQVGRFVGVHHTGLLPLLVHREATKGASWKRLKAGDPIYTTDELVSLPGYASEVRLDSGLYLLLRGNLPEFVRPYMKPDSPLYAPQLAFLLDCSVALHKPAQGFDADLTLHRGRLFLTNGNKKGSLVVRLRFEKQQWDVTLRKPGTEVMVELLRHYPRNTNYLAGQPPAAGLFLAVLKGSANLHVGPFRKLPTLNAPPGLAFYAWNTAKGPDTTVRRLTRIPPMWSKLPPANRGTSPEKDPVLAMTRALRLFCARSAGKSPLVALEESLGKGSDQTSRVLAIYSLCALDEVRKLMEILGDDDPNRAPERQFAIYALRRWISRGVKQGNRLYDRETRTGILLEKMKYDPSEAHTILMLLHDFSDSDRQQPETFRFLAEKLASKKVAIAELAWYHLTRLSRDVPLPRYNADLSQEHRRKVSAEIKKLIDAGKLPPRPDKAPAKPIPRSKR